MLGVPAFLRSSRLRLSPLAPELTSVSLLSVYPLVALPLELRIPEAQRLGARPGRALPLLQLHVLVVVVRIPHLQAAAQSKIYRLFGREKPVHQVFGGGKLADVLLWRNKKISAAILGVATAMWVLFELMEYHLLTLVCHGLILALAILFLWSNATTFINKSPPRIPEVSIPEEPILQFASVLRLEFNRAAAVLREISSGRNLKKFLAVIAGLWVVSIVGSWCNFLTLFYIDWHGVGMSLAMLIEFEEPRSSSASTNPRKAVGLISMSLSNYSKANKQLAFLLITEVGYAFLCSANWISGVVVLYRQVWLDVVALGSVHLNKQLTRIATLNFSVDLVNIVILRHCLQMASPKLILNSLTVAFKRLHSHDSYFIGIIGFVVLWFHWFIRCLSTILPPHGCHLDFFKSSGGILFLFVTYAPSDYLFGGAVGNHFQVMTSWISIIVWTNHLGFYEANPTSAWSYCSATASQMQGDFEEIHVAFQHLVVIFTSRLFDFLPLLAGFEEPLLKPLSLPLLWCLPYISCNVCSHSQATLVINSNLSLVEPLRVITWSWSDVILSISHYLVDVIVLFY